MSFMEPITRFAGRSLLNLKSASPTILVAAGIAGVVGTVYLASKATLKAQPVAAELSDELDRIDEQDTKARVEAISNSAKKLIKLYSPSLVLGAASIACILGGHGILSRRNAILGASLTAVQQTFDRYRNRVIDAIGAEKEYAIRYPDPEKVGVEVSRVGEDGATENGLSLSRRDYSIYARFFDESSPHFCKTAEYNLLFLSGAQRRANDRLRANGHIFLNEVYDILGLPHSQVGQLVGWIYQTEDGDGYVDFGFHDIDSERARSFVNGYERAVLLDFNVDGVVYDLI